MVFSLCQDTLRKECSSKKLYGVIKMTTGVIGEVIKEGKIDPKELTLSKYVRIDI